MLKITNDGRKLALEQRLIDETLDDFDGSKVNACIQNVLRIYDDLKQIVLNDAKKEVIRKRN